MARNEEVEVSQFYDSIADTYDDGFLQNPGVHKLIEEAKLFLPSQARILDMGCGTGKPVASNLVAAGHHVVGLDLSPEMVELSRKNVPGGRFLVADMLSYHPVSNGQAHVDAVFSVFSLFRLSREEQESAIGSWGSWLKPKGLLCIATVAADDWDPEEIRDRLDGDGLCARDVQVQFLGNTVARTFLTVAGWTQLFQKNGFEIMANWSESFVLPSSFQTQDMTYRYLVARKMK